MVVQLFKPQVMLPSAKQAPTAAPKFAATEALLPTLQKGPDTDVFERKATTPAATADQLTTLLKSDADKKANGARLFELTTGVKLGGQVAGQASESKQADLKTAAESIKAMTPVQRVELMQKLTGPESPYSKIAETILIDQQLPNMKDLTGMFKPGKNEANASSGLAAIGAAFQSAAMGLLMLPIVCPASLLFRPELLGQVMASAALVGL